MGTKEKLKVHIEFCERNNEDMDATSWGMEEGVIISGNEAKTFLKLIEQSTSQKETIERLREMLQKIVSAEPLDRWMYMKAAEQLLSTTEPIDQ